MNPFSKHLSFEVLADIAEGQTDSVFSADVQSHLANCDQCRTTLKSVERIVAAMRSDELLAPPAYVTERALQVFRPSEPPISGIETALRSLLALLRFDSGLTPAYGMRSSPGQDRQLFFTIDEFDIDVRLELNAGAWRVEGQLLGGDAAGTAELAGAEHHYMGELNDLGEFVFAGVRPDSYHLHIALPGVEIFVPELVLTK
jgi:hypothetical protein